MPYVNIKITREGATAEQKARLIAGATQLRIQGTPYSIIPMTSPGNQAIFR